MSQLLFVETFQQPFYVPTKHSKTDENEESKYNSEKKVTCHRWMCLLLLYEVCSAHRQEGHSGAVIRDLFGPSWFNVHMICWILAHYTS